MNCRAKAPCFGADVGDTRGCHDLLEDVAVVLFSVSGLQVKTYVRCGLSSGEALHRSFSCGALSWSLVVLSRSIGAV